MIDFIKSRFRAFGYAFKGAWLLIKREASIQVQLSCAILVTLAGFYFEISTTEWLIQILAIALVLAVEGLNTAVEEMADFVHPDFHSSIGRVKDIAAGAVTFAALGALIAGVLIYGPRIF
ncbi:diacylglycerol kinase [Croceiramulus getboli]|nr:diacylglycerol kinase family protein [Flavobacteriaceae bacterium YJPT1-3]